MGHIDNPRAVNRDAGINKGPRCAVGTNLLGKDTGASTNRLTKMVHQVPLRHMYLLIYCRLVAMETERSSRLT